MIDITEMEKKVGLSDKSDFNPILLTAEEAAKYTGFSVHTLRAKKDQFIHSQPAGKYGQIFFLKSGLEDFIRSRLFVPNKKNNKDTIENDGSNSEN